MASGAGGPGSCRICGACRVVRYSTPYAANLWLCTTCHARFVYPPPAPAELERRYESEHRAGKWRAFFDQVPESEAARRAKALSDLLSAPGRVLDVGCGDGRFLDAAKREGWETVGLEVSETAARTVVAEHPVLVGPLSAFQVGPRFDAVTLWDVLEHVPDPTTMVREASRLLKPGGVVAMTMPNVGGTESLAFRSGWRYYDLDAYGHLFHLGPRHLSWLLECAGLETVYVETSGSVDLRDLLRNAGDGLGARAGRLVLDRLSGLVARIAVPLKRGNTLMVMGSRPDANGA